ncbi:hypothetical protein M419DRAFT_132213 [Trichoderma reesei RUT C-30]|uniref:HXXEE domain-containing protein n=1 Tax=Hypocrea jecorina (strain ATCC 56765 / BCRC 32924 / NRRL 11460 / Rut C-30) TaxID=1344414 RepID=A0A024S2Y5_HYPJR|nr:hypothetical protein M419DRAFT_132213 [Trichoderma reesei RUT C-30]
MGFLSDWPFIGLLAGIPLIYELLKPTSSSLGADTRVQPRWSSLLNDKGWWMRAALPIYLLHQFEEHGYDFLGRRYAFRAYFCKNLGFEDIEACPLTPLVILFVNGSLVWITGLAARVNIQNARSFYGFTLINGLTHVLPAIFAGPRYNPGLVTTLILFFPGAFFALRALGGAKRGIAAGVVCHIVLMGSMKLAAKGLIPEGALCGVQVLDTLLFTTIR